MELQNREAASPEVVWGARAIGRVIAKSERATEACGKIDTQFRGAAVNNSGFETFWRLCRGIADFHEYRPAPRRRPRLSVFIGRGIAKPHTANAGLCRLGIVGSQLAPPAIPHSFTLVNRAIAPWGNGGSLSNETYRSSARRSGVRH
jgi:hypothetical protein